MTVNPISLQNLKPIKKGEVRNPHGQSNPLTVLVKQYSNNGKELIKRAWTLLGKTRSDFLKFEIIKWMCDRGWGKPVEIDRMNQDGSVTDGLSQSDIHRLIVIELNKNNNNGFDKTKVIDAEPAQQDLAAE